MKKINIHISGIKAEQSFVDSFRCDECIFHNQDCSGYLGMAPDCLFATRLARNAQRIYAVYNMSDSELDIEMLESNKQSFEQLKSALQATKNIYKSRTR